MTSSNRLTGSTTFLSNLPSLSDKHLLRNCKSRSSVFSTIRVGICTTNALFACPYVITDSEL